MRSVVKTQTLLTCPTHPEPCPLTTHPPAVHMLELHLPHPMPHAVPRDRPFDFYASSRPLSKMDATRQMQLPMPQFNAGHRLDALRAAQRAQPLTPSSDFPGSAVRVVSLPPAEGTGQEYGYQLPAIGNSRTATPQSPRAQRQAQQPAQSMAPQQPVQNMAQRKISANLRVPATISTPQDGLPQLAAEVSFGDCRCLAHC